MHDPLRLRNAPNIHEALKIIANAGRKGETVWHARADRSATMVKEHYLWEQIGFQPWNDATDKDIWYFTNLQNPAGALVAADAAGAYHLTDRSTLLRQTAMRTIENTTVFFEPTSSTDVLLNSCWACRASRVSSKEAEEHVDAFLKWLTSEHGQEVVATFGEQEAGLPFFAKVTDGFCPHFLRNGRAHGGKWIGSLEADNT